MERRALAVFAIRARCPMAGATWFWSIFMDPARRTLHADWNKGAAG